jgi:hypothetical protein
MAQRREPRVSLDDFPTPPWATRALITHVLAEAIPDMWRVAEIWEPCCGRGSMARTLRERFKLVRATDIADYSSRRWQHGLLNFIKYDFSDMDTVSWVITNPPFRLAQQFVLRARLVATQGVAVLVRTSFLESLGRYKYLFERTPPKIVAQFSERVPMVRGRLDPEASTATSYCWMVWYGILGGTHLMWIPPCRLKLEQEGDYD